jgi:pyridoxamine 5'-phosphate oxidase
MYDMLKFASNKIQTIMDLAAMRRDYKTRSLSEADVLPDAVEQFRKWFHEAVEMDVPEANAMVLATATKEGKPSARVLLLKGVNEDGFIFYTNYESRKGRELIENPQASMVFLWHELERQIRIEGTVKKLSKQESELYFYSRPFQSQVSALISPQSKVIHGKKELEELHQKTMALHEGSKLPFPENWGGFILVPMALEFWQGRESRFHDRIQYTKTSDDWKIERLAP